MSARGRCSRTSPGDRESLAAHDVRWGPRDRKRPADDLGTLQGGLGPSARRPPRRRERRSGAMVRGDECPISKHPSTRVVPQESPQIVFPGRWPRSHLCGRHTGSLETSLMDRLRVSALWSTHDRRLGLGGSRLAATSRGLAYLATAGAWLGEASQARYPRLCIGQSSMPKAGVRQVHRSARDVRRARTHGGPRDADASDLQERLSHG